MRSEPPPRPDDIAVPTDILQGPPEVMPSRLRLDVVDGPDRGRGLVLTRGTYVVGKSVGCDLVLADRTVSRRHLEIVVHDHRILCRDLESKNGSFYNGARFAALEAHVGASLVLGMTTLRIATPDTRLALAPSDATTLGGMVGQSVRMREVFALMERAAASDAPVLILGETGTGKEVCASAIHRLSNREDGPFVVCDLAALSRNLIESELFGHVRGAFTGAVSDRPGAFAQANGGTIFIDELGELEADMQPRLLRALDRKQVKQVGSQIMRPIDCRVIAATQRPLEAEVQAGRFRQDLYYRLAVLRIVLPPLRERKEDIPPLVDRFVSEFQPGRVVEVPSETIAILREYDWPGNVRELRNTIERSLAMSPDVRRLDPHVLGLELSGLPEQSAVDPDLPFHEAKERLVRAWEQEYLSGLLRRTNGNVSEAARRAGIDRVHLYRLLKKHTLVT
jgi:transcriptional regulator with PAS, ATPase and Fis domain